MPALPVLAVELGTGVPIRAWWVLVGTSHMLLGPAWVLIPSVIHAEDQARPCAAAEAV